MFSRNKPKTKSKKADVELSEFKNPETLSTSGRNPSGKTPNCSPIPGNHPPISPPRPPVPLIPELDSNFSGNEAGSGVYNSLSVSKPNGGLMSGALSEMSLLRQEQDFDEPIFINQEARKGHRRRRALCSFLIGGSILLTVLVIGVTFPILFQWPFQIWHSRSGSNSSNLDSPFPVNNSTNGTENREDMDEDLIPPKPKTPPDRANGTGRETVPKTINFPIPDLRTRMHEEFKAILLGPPDGPLIKPPDGNASLSQSTRSGTSPSFLPISPVANASVVGEGIKAGSEALLDRQKTEERIQKLGLTQSSSFSASSSSIVGEEGKDGNGSDVTRNQFYSYSTIPREEADSIHQLSLIGFSMVRASRIIAKRLNLSKAEAEDGIILDVKAKIEPSAWCTAQNAHTLDRNCNTTEEYRDGLGKCNNLNHPQWGAALQPYRRILGSDYGDDGISSPRKSSDGVRALPNAKYISNVMFKERRLNYSSPLSMLFPMWAEFIERDMTEIVPSSGGNNTGITCCENGKLLEIQHPECFPIISTPEDEFYDRVDNQTCISVVRSGAAPTCSFGTREQFNLESAFIDGSTIYGARTGGKDGKMEPDERSMNFIWMTHHNRIVEQLAIVNPHWNGERLFQETKRIVVAQTQHITFNEYLPLLFGNNLMLRAGLKLAEKGYCEGYDKLVDPGISNAFASTASKFRISMVPELLARQPQEDSSPNGTLPSNRSSNLIHPLPNPFLRGQPPNATVLEFQIRDFLFNRSGISDTSFSQQGTSSWIQGQGSQVTDLAAIVIQRGRDHGIPAYPRWRQICGLKEVHNWTDLEGIWEKEDIERAQQVYTTFDDVDLYVGGVAEIHEGNGSVGPTFACLLADQFLRARKGDRFWYEGDIQIKAFSPVQLSSIRNVSLAGILCQIFETLGAIQGHALKGVSDDNLILPCQTLLAPSHLNFSAWKEEKPIPGIQFPHIWNGTTTSAN